MHFVLIILRKNTIFQRLIYRKSVLKHFEIFFMKRILSWIEIKTFMLSCTTLNDFINLLIL